MSGLVEGLGKLVVKYGRPPLPKKEEEKVLTGMRRGRERTRRVRGVVVVKNRRGEEEEEGEERIEIQSRLRGMLVARTVEMLESLAWRSVSNGDGEDWFVLPFLRVVW